VADLLILIIPIKIILFGTGFADRSAAAKTLSAKG
jgi:hypothetical protein